MKAEILVKATLRLSSVTTMAQTLGLCRSTRRLAHAITHDNQHGKHSFVGYNNNLTRVTDDMKLGVNNNVNQGTHKASLKLMAGGPSKVKPPNSHPSNPIHKKATEAQGLAVKKKPTQTQTQTLAQPTTTTEPVDSHHLNKALVVIGALAFVGLIYAAS